MPKPASRVPEIWPSAAEIAREIARCAADFCYFAHTYCKILVRDDGGSRDVEPFVLWDYQARIGLALQQGSSLIILKARQLGITTVICAWADWVALFKPNSYSILLSQRDREARKLLRRVVATYDNLPSWMKAAFPAGGTRNTTTFTLANGSMVEAMASTEDTGRSETASFAFLDEADYMADLEETYGAVKPTIDGGGQMVVASTSTGPMTYFSQLWDWAVQRLGELRGVFIPWHARPGRDQAWYDKTTAGYTDHRRKREYPATPEDAFTSAEALVYPDFASGRHMEEMAVVRETDEATGRVQTYVDCKRYGRFKIVGVQAAQDFNMAQPGCVLVGMQASDGTILIVDGWYEADVPVTSENPDELTWGRIDRRLYDTYRFNKLWCDHDTESIKALGRFGLPACPAIKEVDPGISLVTAALRKREGERPGLIIDRRLEWMAKEFYSYKRRMQNGLVTDFVVKQFDHSMDALRYLLSGLMRGQPKIKVF